MHHSKNSGLLTVLAVDSNELVVTDTLICSIGHITRAAMFTRIRAARIRYKPHRNLCSVRAGSSTRLVRLKRGARTARYDNLQSRTTLGPKFLVLV